MTAKIIWVSQKRSQSPWTEGLFSCRSRKWEFWLAYPGTGKTKLPIPHMCEAHYLPHILNRVQAEVWSHVLWPVLHLKQELFLFLLLGFPLSDMGGFRFLPITTAIILVFLFCPFLTVDLFFCTVEHQELKRGHELEYSVSSLGLFLVGEEVVRDSRPNWYLYRWNPLTESFPTHS